MKIVDIELDSKEDIKLLQKLLSDKRSLRIILKKYKCLLESDSANPTMVGLENLSEDSLNRIEMLKELPVLAESALTFVDMLTAMGSIGADKAFIDAVNHVYLYIQEQITQHGETLQ